MLVPEPDRKYRITRYLTEGGMGAIYLGKRLGAGGFEKEVVLKQLLPEFAARPEFRDLFFREARISATLDHINIVRTFDLVTSDDALFIVMEYVRGADLRTIAWRAKLQRRVLSPAAIIHVALEILAGLAYAHARKREDGSPLGVIHRDVSPSNILCSAQGDVKLSDFGIAKAATASSVFYRVRGKVGYMSPEQAGNQPLDNRSDLFSLAVCIFETLSGERLYAGDLHTPPDVVYAARVPRLSARRPDLPFEFEPVMDKALALRREDRFADAASFAEALRDVARRHGLLYSASALAAELTALLGPDADRWNQEDAAVSQNTDRLPIPPGMLGREATPVSDDLNESPPAPGAVPGTLIRGTGTAPLFPVNLPGLPPSRQPGPLSDALPPPPWAGLSGEGERSLSPRSSLIGAQPEAIAQLGQASTGQVAGAQPRGVFPRSSSSAKHAVVSPPEAAFGAGSAPLMSASPPPGSPSPSTTPTSSASGSHRRVSEERVAVAKIRTVRSGFWGWMLVLVVAAGVGIGVSFLWNSRGARAPRATTGTP